MTPLGMTHNDATELGKPFLSTPRAANEIKVAQAYPAFSLKVFSPPK